MIKKKNYFSGEKNILDPDEILADSISALKGSGNVWEDKMEKPIGRLSSLLFLCLILVGMGYLLKRAATLQIVQGEDFFSKSQENRFLMRTLFPARGLFYDHNGAVLVENAPSFSVIFQKDAFMNAITAVKPASSLCPEPSEAAYKQKDSPKNTNIPASMLQTICNNSLQETKHTTQKLTNVIALLSEILKKDKAFFSTLGFSDDFNIKHIPSRIVIAQDIGLDVSAEISARRDLLPGVEIIESYKRIYKNPIAFSHVLGFTGKISEADLAMNPNYQFEETIGKSGLEQFYDSILRGVPGKKIIEVDSRGKETQFRFTETPKSGLALKLAIDGKLQRVVYDLMKSYTNGTKGGSAVIVDVRTGALRALVSFPGFDSNLLGSGISKKEFDQILGNHLKPLFNRSIAGEFPSGSIIKPLFAASALQEHLINPHKKIYDEGFISIPNPYRPDEVSIFKDWRKQGWIDFYDAIAYSANVYFYMIGGGYGDQKGLGIERLKKYALAFGLGNRLGIDLPGEKSGLFPDPASKNISDPDDPLWRIGDTYNVSIGQGGVKVTPLQMTSATAAIANGGILYKPYLLDAIFDEEGNTIKQTNPHIIRDRIIEETYLNEVRKGMRKTVTSGTARVLNELPIQTAAKTGTAQTGGTFTHAWFTAFAPYENPEIALTIMVEHGGEGATTAGPIAREILKWYFTRHDSNVSDTLSISPVPGVNTTSTPAVLPVP